MVGPILFTAGKSIVTTGGYADPTNGYRKDLMGNPGPKEAVINSPEEARQVEEVMDLMKQKGTYYVPTITAGKYVEQAKVPGYYHPLVVPKALEVGPLIQETSKKTYKRGVKIAFGTDAGVFPHGEMVRNSPLWQRQACR